MCALGFEFCPIQSSIFDMLEPNMVCLYIGSGFQVSVLHFSLDYYLHFGLDNSTCQFLDALRNFFLSFITIYSFLKFLFFFVFF